MYRADLLLFLLSSCQKLEETVGPEGKHRSMAGKFPHVGYDAVVGLPVDEIVVGIVAEGGVRQLLRCVEEIRAIDILD